MTTDRDLNAAKELLAENGHTVLKTKSYLAAQERQRIAKIRMEDALERVASVEQWAREAHAETRRLADRLTHVYGVAVRHGASYRALRGK